jgi:hypothetical protein
LISAFLSECEISQHTNGLQDGWGRNRSSIVDRDKRLFTASRTDLDPPSLLSSGYQGLFARKLNGRGVKLTTHLI